MEDRNQRSEWVRGFEELEVFQRAYRLSLEVHRASLELPRIEQFALADQIRRASKSICANLAKGLASSAVSKPEFRRFVMMATGLGRRDAGMDALLPRSRLYRRAMWPSAGGASTGRSPGCCRALYRGSSDL